jgi:hypothetical protein
MNDLRRAVGASRFVLLLLLTGLGVLPASASTTRGVEVVGWNVSDATFGSHANGDGVIESGEYILIEFFALNLGPDEVFPSGYLSYTGSLPGVVVWDGYSPWHQIPPNTVAPTDPPWFQIRLSGALACGMVLPFHLSIVDDFGSLSESDIAITLGDHRYYDLLDTPSTRSDQSEATFWGGAPGQTAGRAVAFGDFNGDGLKDAVIAVPSASISGRTQAGAVYIAFGRPETWGDTDLGAPPGGTTRIVGADPQDNLGLTLATGDLNGDGRDELIVAAPGGDGPGTGACPGGGVGDRCDSGDVYVVFGRSAFPSTIDLANPASAAHIFGPVAGEGIINGMAAGDLDGDGLDDLAIGYRLSMEVRGRGATGTAFVVYGRTSWPAIDLATPPTSVARFFGAINGEHLGDRISVGDLDGDGFADLVLSRPNAAENATADVGEIDVLYGSAGRLGDVDLAVSPAGVTRFLGESGGDLLDVSAVGDFDGDGQSDLALGAPTPGKIYIAYGPVARDQTVELGLRLPWLAHIWGAGDQAGGAFAAGDIDGDGYDDLAIGAVASASIGNARPGAGRIHILHGKAQRWQAQQLNSPLPRVESIFGADSGDSLGFSIAAGDADGDGLADLLLGAPNAAGPANSRPGGGEAALWYGKPFATFTPHAGPASFINAAPGGTTLPMCDDCEVLVPIGFNFQYDGQDFNQVYVLSNGLISFKPVADSTLTRVPECMPDRSPVSGVNGEIAVYWADLNPGVGSAVYSRVDGASPHRRLTIEWAGVSLNGAPGTGTFEVSLYEDSGQIVMQYLDLDFGDPSRDNGLSAVIGVENLTGTHGVAASCFSNSQVTGGTALRFMPSTSITEQTVEHGLGLWTPVTTTHAFHPSQNVCEPDQHAGNRSWYAGFEPACSYNEGIAVSPWDLLVPTVTSFPSDAAMTYSFRQQVDTLTGQIRDPCVVQASTTGTGGTYTTYQSAIINSGTWQTLAEPIAFPGLAGQTVDLRFRMSPDSLGNNGLGWMVDDIRLNGCNAPNPAGVSMDFLDVATICYGSSAHLDGVGSYCPGGSAPLQHHWLVDGVEVATGPAYITAPDLAPGLHAYVDRIDCAGSASIDSPEADLNVASPPAAFGDTLMVSADRQALTLTFHWTNAPDANGYDIMADVVPNGGFPYLIASGTSGTTGATSFLYSDPAIYLKVRPRNVCGTGPIN